MEGVCVREATNITSPMIVGEVLFDQFEDGSVVLGGAPFNVAWHLQGFGMSPLFVSRVGSDANGRAVLSAMARWGLDTSGIQVDDGHPTGTVRVTVDAGQPRFEVTAEQAYDYIDSAPCLALARDTAPSAIYHGTLVIRSSVSRTTLASLKSQSPTPTFIDLNLRSPWWDDALVSHALTGARWVKLNEDELHIVHEQVGGRANSLYDIAGDVRKKFDFELLIVTLGADGAFAVTAEDVVEVQPTRVKNLVDTVGAGDGFSSVALFGLLNNWPLDQTLRRAADFAALICANRGATLADQRIYTALREQWSHSR